VRSLSLPVILTTASLSGSALAAGGAEKAPESAQAIYDKAVAAMERKEYAIACPSLEDVVRRVPEGIGAKLTLAQCYEEQGRLATAYAAYLVAETASLEAKQIERQKKARTRADALRPRLAKLTLFVSEVMRTVKGFQIQCDGAPLDPMQWSVPLPIDRGIHLVTATAPGKKRWEKTIDVRADGASESLTVDTLEDAPPEPEAVKEKPAPSRPLGLARTAGIIAGAGGVLVLGIGTALGVVAINKKGDSDLHCNALDRCDSEGLDLRAAGRTAGTASTVMFILGGAAIAGGVTLFVLGSRSSDAKAAAVVGPGGLAVKGRF